MKRLFPTSLVLIVFFATCLAADLRMTGAAQPVVHLPQQRIWPGGPRGTVYDVATTGNYAYVALGTSGIDVIDIGDPTNSVYLSNTKITGAYRLEIVGNLLYACRIQRWYKCRNLQHRQPASNARGH